MRRCWGPPPHGRWGPASTAGSACGPTGSRWRAPPSSPGSRWPRDLRGVLRVPAAALLADHPVLLQRRQHAVQVVLLDAHLVGQLRDRDPGRGAHDGQRLLGARAGALGPAAAAGAGGRRLAGGGGAGTAWGGGGGAHAVERLHGGLEAVILLDERFELG